MSRKISRAAYRNLVAQVAPKAEQARRIRSIREMADAEGKRISDEVAEARRQAAPHPLEAAVAKFEADKKAAAEKDAFVLKDQTDVFVSGTTLRERKDEAARAIRKSNKKGQGQEEDNGDGN